MTTKTEDMGIKLTSIDPSLKKCLEVVYKKNTKEDWDTVWIIDGDEGASKSNLALHICQWWYDRINADVGGCSEKEVKHMCLDPEQFKKDLAGLKKFEFTCFDEAGALSNRRFMDKFNHEISQAYMMIRGDNLFTVLVLPSFFDLDPYFSKRRVRGLIHVYKRGRFSFWSKHRLRNLAMINAGYPVKNYWVVKPTIFRGRFGKYNGILEEPYKKLKKEKMQQVREKLLADDVEKKSIGDPRRENIINAKESGMSNKDIGICFGITGQRVSQLLKSYVTEIET